MPTKSKKKPAKKRTSSYTPGKGYYNPKPMSKKEREKWEKTPYKEGGPVPKLRDRTFDGKKFIHMDTQLSETEKNRQKKVYENEFWKKENAKVRTVKRKNGTYDLYLRSNTFR